LPRGELPRARRARRRGAAAASVRRSPPDGARRRVGRRGKPPGDRVTSEPLRILQLYPKEDYFTGAAIQLRELAWGLRDRGHHVVVATRPSEAWAARSREAGMIHYPLPMASEVD